MNKQKFTVDLDDPNSIKGYIANLRRELEKLEPSTATRMLAVDTNSLDDCLRVQNIIKSYIGQLRSSKYGSKNQRTRDRFDACMNIWSADISHLYNDVETDSAPNYYVYAHCEPRPIAIGKDGRTTFGASIGMTHVPFYIGKGVGNRAFDLNRNETHRKVRQRISEFGGEVIVTILKEGLTEREALMYESKLIDIYGLIGKGGILVNLDEGVKNKERKHIYEDSLKQINMFYKELF